MNKFINYMVSDHALFDSDDVFIRGLGVTPGGQTFYCIIRTSAELVADKPSCDSIIQHEVENFDITKIQDPPSYEDLRIMKPNYTLLD
jgi:hypothetical protein